MDKCLTITTQNTGSEAVLLSPSDNNGQLHYTSLGLCMKASGFTSTTIVPSLCPTEGNDDSCTEDPFSYGLQSWTTTSNYGGMVGLARDGHIIMGPYNENGELWDCTTDDIDVCNGRFFDEVDGSYRYVTTETFPYTVGCWGPADGQTTLHASCASKTCGALSGLGIAAATVALALAAITN